VLKEVKNLVDMGVSVIRLHPRQKRPVGNNWSEQPFLSFKQLEAAYQEGENLGVQPVPACSRRGHPRP